MEDIKDFDESFKYYRLANELCFSDINYSINEEKKFFENLKKPKPLENFDLNINKMPIFVLGMPRSGTTLVEQILSSHRLVHGCGELEILNNFVKNELSIFSINANSAIKSFTKKKVKILEKCYKKEIEQLSFSEDIFIDKMPNNFKWINLIVSTLPKAKIIHLKRDPRDTCFSIYKNYFADTFHHGYSFDLKTLALYYNFYADLMDHWEKLFPNKIYSCSYEKLIENPKNEMQKLIDWCQLSWDDNLMKFNENKRSVLTASNIQVRQKIYKSSIGSWSNYQKHLKPLLDNLKI